VNIDILALHTNSNYYKDADKFNPSRWESDEHDQFKYIPFSAGKKNCLG
jgi:cytochrome P450